MGLVTLRQLDGDAQGDQAEFSGLHVHILGGVEVDPVGFACHIAQLVDAVHKIFYLDFFHVKLQNRKQIVLYGFYYTNRTENRLKKRGIPGGILPSGQSTPR